MGERELTYVVKLAFWKPGTDTYLEYNTTSQCIRLKHGAQRRFAGKRIRYTINGPRLITVNDDSDSSLTEFTSDGDDGTV